MPPTLLCHRDLEGVSVGELAANGAEVVLHFSPARVRDTSAVDIVVPEGAWSFVRTLTCGARAGLG